MQVHFCLELVSKLYDLTISIDVIHTAGIELKTQLESFEPRGRICFSDRPSRIITFNRSAFRAVLIWDARKTDYYYYYYYNSFVRKVTSIFFCVVFYYTDPAQNALITSKCLNFSKCEIRGVKFTSIVSLFGEIEKAEPGVFRSNGQSN